MGLKSDLHNALTVLAANGDPDHVLGAWLRQNMKQVLEALDWSDDLVPIAQIDISDLPAIMAKRKAMSATAAHD